MEKPAPSHPGNRLVKVTVACALATSLSPALPLSPAFASEEDNTLPTMPLPQPGPSEGTCGTCGWQIDDQGCLTIYPASYETPGVIDLPDDQARWNGLDDSIVSIRFQGPCKIEASFDASRLFSGLRSLASVDLYGLDVSDATSLANMFSGCTSLTSVNFEGFDSSNITDISGMFKGCSSLKEINVGPLDTTNVRNMSSLFEGCSSLDYIGFWRSGGSSNGEFRGIANLTYDPEPRGFTTENAANMASMFAGCASLAELDLRSFITGKATSMDSLFSGCSSLKTIKVGNKFSLSGATGSRLAPFPAPTAPGALGTWLSTADGQTYASNAIPGNVAATYLAQFAPEAGKTALTPELFSVNCTDAVYTGRGIYQGSYSDALRENTDYTVECYDTVNVGRSVVIMTGKGSYTGRLAFSFNIVKANPEVPDLPVIVAQPGQKLSELALPEGFSWQNGDATVTVEAGLQRALVTYTPADTRNYNTVRDIPAKIGVAQNQPQAASGWQLCGTCEWQVDAAGCLTVRPAGGAAAGYLDAWRSTAPWASVTQDIKTVRFEGHCFAPTLASMFKECGSLDSVDFTGLDSSAAGDMSSMFESCIKIRGVDLTKLNAAHMANATKAFKGCTNLESVALPSFANPVSDASSLFAGCSVLKSCRVPLMRMANGSSLQGMFEGCKSLEAVDIAGLSTKGAANMDSMFKGCANLEALDASGFDTSSVTTMDSMFFGCESLHSLDVSAFDTSHVERFTYLFGNCKALESIDVSRFDTAAARDIGGMFAYCERLTSLDLSSFDTRFVGKPLPPSRDGGMSGDVAGTAAWPFFAGCGSLTTIKLGPNFAFSSLYGDTSRAFAFPQPSGAGYTGKWVNSAGEVFAADAIPNFAADTYTAEIAGGSKPEPGPGPEPTPEPTPDPSPDEPGPEVSVTRLAGEEAADTSAQIARTAFPEGSEWVVIARDDDFADAMSATGLAGALGCPIVLTDRYGLSKAAAGAVYALGAKKAYVIGGKGAIPGNLEDELGKIGCQVQARVFGEESWDTSVACAEKIAEHGGNPNGDAIVAMSSNFQDALSISSFAYKYKVPIYLETSGDSRKLPTEARKAIKRLKGTVYVPGGPGAVPTDSVEGVFGESRVQRIFGEDGYDTSNQIATYMVEHNLLSAGTVCVASGAPDPKGVDALAGAALAGKAGGVMLLSNDNPRFGEVDSTTIDGADSTGAPAFLASHAREVGQAYLLGGSAVVGADLQQKVSGLLG